MNDKINIENIIKRLDSGELLVVNNHTAKEEKIDGYVLLESIADVDGYVCPVFIGTTFCLNFMYEDTRDGRIHLSTTAIGGNMNGVYRNFDKEVKKYNNATIGRRIISYKIFKY